MEYGNVCRVWNLGDDKTLASSMKLDQLTGEGCSRFKYTVTARVRNPAYAVFLERQGDITPDVIDISFQRELIDAVRSQSAGSGRITVYDPDGDYMDSGHTTIKQGDKIKVFGGFGDDLIPRFTGVVTDAKPNLRDATISVGFKDYVEVLQNKTLKSGKYPKLICAKLMLEYLMSQAGLCDAVFEDEEGEPSRMAFWGLPFTCDPVTDIVYAMRPSLYATANSYKVVSTGTLPAPLAVDTNYSLDSIVYGYEWYVNTPAIDLTTAGTGYHFLYSSNASDDQVTLDAKSYWSQINDVCFVLGYACYFDANGVLQFIQKTGGVESGFVFNDGNVVDIQHNDVVELINSITLTQSSPSGSSYDYTVENDVSIERFGKKSLAQSTELCYVRFANDLDIFYARVVRAINKYLDFHAYPRHLFVIKCAAIPHLEIGDRVMVDVARRNVVGSFRIYGIKENITSRSYDAEYILISEPDKD